MKKFTLPFVLFLAACSSTPKPEELTATPETRPDVVLSRSDDLKARPSWVRESAPFRQENEKVISQGFAQIPLDHNLNAAYRICFNNSKSHIASAIQQKLEYVFQQSSEGSEMDSSTAQFIGSEMSSMTTNSMRQANQYYEKVATTLDSGERKTFYKVFCTTEMPTSDFKRHLFGLALGSVEIDWLSGGFIC